MIGFEGHYGKLEFLTKVVERDRGCMIFDIHLQYILFKMLSKTVQI